MLHVCGRPIHFDLTSLASDNTIQTGTILFMARVMHVVRWGSIAQSYELDVESFLWVAMWVVSCSGDTSFAPDIPLLRWGTDKLSVLRRKTKSFVLFFCSKDAKLQKLWEPWRPLQSIVDNTPDFMTENPDKMYAQLLAAKLEGEKSFLQTKPPRSIRP
jgi:hypothetical protein